MLSTKFGYLRPAERARALASLFCFRESEVDVLFGFFRFHGGCESDRSIIYVSCTIEARRTSG
jgi:hypothetical protein